MGVDVRIFFVILIIAVHINHFCILYGYARSGIPSCCTSICNYYCYFLRIAVVLCAENLSILSATTKSKCYGCAWCFIACFTRIAFCIFCYETWTKCKCIKSEKREMKRERMTSYYFISKQIDNFFSLYFMWCLFFFFFASN